MLIPDHRGFAINVRYVPTGHLATGPGWHCEACGRTSVTIFDSPAAAGESLSYHAQQWCPAQ